MTHCTRMLNVKGFIDGRITSTLNDTCKEVGVNANLMREDTFERIRELAAESAEMNEYDLIRHIYTTMNGTPHMVSHLAACFGLNLSQISKIIHDPRRGHRKNGRPRKLTGDQEQQVLQYVRDCQLRGQYTTISELTHWINQEFLQGGDSVSRKFLQNNRVIMENLVVVTPKSIEELRLEACTYENIVSFFNKLENMTSSYEYDPDLIINVDETTTFVDVAKRPNKVLCDKNIDTRPICVVPTRQECITLCCAVSASGNLLTPTFIIKNKVLSAEKASPQFDCGPFAIASSADGWQESKTVRQWLEHVLIPYRHSLNKTERNILLIMNSHSAQTIQDSVQFCEENGIHVCFLPPYTSHVLQPLDSGIFHAYKKACRRVVHSESLSSIDFEETSDTTRNRCIMLGRALIANIVSIKTHSIRRAFYHTGIYPLSLHHFLYYCSDDVRNVPEEVKHQAKLIIEEENATKRQRI